MINKLLSLLAENFKKYLAVAKILDWSVVSTFSGLSLEEKN